ncbi:TMEM165/GDT1 family protein [Candidatus Izimaplasma bacterium ZiA1]|uniref:TMEM165/GDT1 family protein n=1 Tax=Candidatus Izimoplasma sp. ZiA1 TaxID=2024899 RepID=UPI0014398328
MINEMIQAFFLIFLAEMGDKTQILAMAFATKYKIRHVVLGIFIGSFLNHALAVILGSSLSNFIPLNTLSIIAGVMFLIFALWSLKFEDEEEEVKVSKYGPVITVSLAFFIGELGDKTQLAAITLATDANYPLFILAGTVTGMVVTGLLGIFVGIKLGSKIPEFYMKIGASIVFFIFGLVKLGSSLDQKFLNPIYVALFVLVLLVVGYLILRPTLNLRRLGKKSAYVLTAERLKGVYSIMYNRLEDICLGENTCGTCGGNSCLVGYTKKVLKDLSNGAEINLDYIENLEIKKFDKTKILESLILVTKELKNDWINPSFDNLHHLRNNLEMMLFNKKIVAETYNDYLNKIEEIDKKVFLTLK